MEYVPFEIAKKLKEKRFPQTPDYYCYVNYSSYYEWYGLRKTHSLSNESVWFDTNINRDNHYFAPTISQVLKWLREEKGIHIEIRLFCIGYGFDIIQVTDRKKLAWSGTYERDTYEQAALAGIEYSLDNLI